MFSSCHDHVLDLVASHLDVRELTKLACVDRRWRDVCRPRIEDIVRAEFDDKVRPTFDAIVNRHWATGTRALARAKARGYTGDGRPGFAVRGYTIYVDAYHGHFTMKTLVVVCGVRLVIDVLATPEFMHIDTRFHRNVFSNAAVSLVTSEPVSRAPAITEKAMRVSSPPEIDPHHRNISAVVSALVQEALTAL